MTGRSVRMALACICCDRPAAIAVTGAGHYRSSDTPCLRCTIHATDISVDTSTPFPRNSYQHGLAMLSQSLTAPGKVRDAEALYHADRSSRRLDPRPFPVHQRQLAEDNARPMRGHLSACDLLPYFDKFNAAVFDPMHGLLEG